MASTADSHGHGTHGHDHGAHRGVGFYLAIALLLTVLTAIELGPLFEFYTLPAPALLALSAVKFFFVVAFFMHLWDDPPVFARLFAAPLIGAALMVIVLMVLHHTFFPTPADDHDPVPVAERYRDNFNGHCASWLRSHQTNRWYCASAADEVQPSISNDRIAQFARVTGGGAAQADAGPSVDLAAMSETERQQWLVKRGEEVYVANCSACHQTSGAGVPGVFPPLAGSGEFYGDAKNHARIVVHGLSGPITVQGVAYNSTMPPLATLSDIDIAAVTSYERNSWGNADGYVMPEDVAAVR